MTYIFAQNTASITELKINPMQVMAEAEGAPVAILNRNKPAFYCVPPEAYEKMMDMLEDMELAAIVRARATEPRIEVSIDDLMKM